MEVKPGYKLTDAGILPGDWDVRPLGEIVTIVSGSTPKTGVASYWNGGISWCTPTDITSTPGKWLSKTARTISALGLSRSSATLLPPGALLLCSRATIGEVKIAATEICTNQGFKSLICGAAVNYDFLYYLLLTMKPKMVEQAIGSTFLEISKFATAALEVLLPPLSEQRAIAAALSDVDALLAAQDKLIAKKQGIKQAIMQELLTGKRRLLGFGGNWKMIRFDDLADPLSAWSLTGGPFGSNLKVSDYVKEGVRIIQLQNIGDGMFHNDYAIYTSEQKADELVGCNIYPGDIILSKMGDPVARACFVPNSGTRFLMASDGIRLAVDPKRFDKRFVFAYINSPAFRKSAIEASTGSTRQRIKIVDLKKLPFVEPPLDEQRAIATVLSDMDAEIAALTQKRDKTRLLKQGMMQELLTGRTRLV